MGTCAAIAAPETSGRLVPPALLVGMAGENSGSSWWDTTCHSTGETLVATALFFQNRSYKIITANTVYLVSLEEFFIQSF